jgi:signal transduction histidine kinase
MNLMKRLLFANAATVIIPLGITALVALAFFYIFNPLANVGQSMKSYQKLSEIRYELEAGQNGVLQKNPGKLEEEAFQKYLQEQLAQVGGELVILKGDGIVFSTRNFSPIDVAKCLDTKRSNREKEPLVLGNTSYSVQLLDFKYTDGTAGHVILLAPLAQDLKNTVRFLAVIVLTFVFVFILTNLLVSYRYAKTLVTPLRNLQKAASRIREGNLDQPIIEEGDQEVQALCRDLELMRIRLKESVSTQLKYEDNRKMLISSISHDLKTPITAIKGYVEGILDGVANTPEKTAKYLDTIYLKAEQVDQMIDDLLLYAKLDLNQLPFDFENTDIASYLAAFFAENEAQLEAHGVTLKFQNNLSGPKSVSLDRERMKRVLMNILDNSLKYMNKNPGEITVSLRETAASVIMELRDNGSGIREQDLPHIFDRFYRSDASRGEIKGSGLGLAIAKQIVGGHQGTIWAVGHGAAGTSILISLKI